MMIQARIGVGSITAGPGRVNIRLSYVKFHKFVYISTNNYYLGNSTSLSLEMIMLIS